VHEKQPDQFEAMVQAMTKSFSVILSSAAVTFFGFLSLAAMQFLIGADMGIALAKGIVCSFFSITLFMPCILYMMRNAVEKTMHKAVLQVLPQDVEGLPCWRHPCPHHRPRPGSPRLSGVGLGELHLWRQLEPGPRFPGEPRL
jgi:predicted RND superfamily exporter protein